MTNNRRCNEINLFDTEHADRNSAHAFRIRGKHMFQSVPRARRLGFGPSAVRWILGFSGAAVFFGFVAFQIWQVIAPPQLIIDTPTDASVTRDPQIIVSGHTAPETAVEINGQSVFARPDGTFTQPVELQVGSNQIFIRATKQHGLFTTISRTIMLEAPSGVSMLPPISPVGSGAAERNLN